MGIPSVITTDQGKKFRNELNKQLTDSFGIKHRLTTAYHPQVPMTTYRVLDKWYH